MDVEKVLRIIGAELSQAQGGNGAGDDLQQNRMDALSYYLGNPNGREVKGKSTVTSTDVADAIEWIMPQILKALTQNNEVVRFDPAGADDEAQAELESDFVYDLLMKDNDGFILIHQFVKDALMQKNGFLKTYYEKTKEIKKEDYTGINDMQLQVLLSDQYVELVQMTTYQDPMIGNLHDVRISRTCEHGRIKVVSVAPENIRVRANHSSISMKECRFMAHIEEKTVSDLIEAGYDRETIESAITVSQMNNSDYRFNLQGENTVPREIDFSDESQRLVDIAECYTYIDIDGDGIGEYVKVTVIGHDNPSAILDIEEIDSCPFISATAILMSHKLYGLSIYDRLKQIQDHKTALWRNTMDNIYLQNNQRLGVLDGQVNLDDLLLSRPGGIVRMKSAEAIIPITTPQIGDAAYKMLDYLDMTRAGRVGVDANGDVQLDNVGDRVGSQGIDRVMNAKEELVNLMIRVIAETGIKPLCYAIRDLAVKHMDSVTHFRFKESWAEVNPSTWNRRLRSTVRVGLGTGDRRLLLEGAQAIIALQEKALSVPGQTLVKPTNIYNSIKFAAKQYGIDGVGRFFISPESPEGKQFAKEQDQKAQEQRGKEEQIAAMAAQAQIKLAEAEQMKANATHQGNMLKAENEQLKTQINALKEQAAAKQKNEELDFKYYQEDNKVAIALTELEVAANRDLSAQNEANKGNGDVDGPGTSEIAE